MTKSTITTILVGAASIFIGQWAYAQYIKKTTVA
jgi:hypothetical protein